MKNIILASIALLTFTVANAQTVNTEIQSKGNGNERKAIKKPIATTPDAKAERLATRMKSEYTLDDAQYTKLLALKKEKYTEAEAVAEKNPGAENRDARVAGFKPIRDAYVASLKEILTAEQFTKYQENTKTRFAAWKKSMHAQPNTPKPDDEEQQIKMDIV